MKADKINYYVTYFTTMYRTPENGCDGKQVERSCFQRGSCILAADNLSNTSFDKTVCNSKYIKNTCLYHDTCGGLGPYTCRDHSCELRKDEPYPVLICRACIGELTLEMKKLFEKKSKIQDYPYLVLNSEDELGLSDPDAKFDHERLILIYGTKTSNKHGRDSWHQHVQLMYSLVQLAEEIKNCFRPSTSNNVEPPQEQSTTSEQLPVDTPAKKPKKRLSTQELEKRALAAIADAVKRPDLSTGELEKLHELSPKTLSKPPYRKLLKQARETRVVDKERSVLATPDKESDGKFNSKEFGESLRTAKQQKNELDDLIDRKGTIKEP